jgi:hypothetical protein
MYIYDCGSFYLYHVYYCSFIVSQCQECVLGRIQNHILEPYYKFRIHFVVRIDWKIHITMNQLKR